MFARTQRLMLRPAWPEDAPIVSRLTDGRMITSFFDSALNGVDPLFPACLMLRRTHSAPQIIGGCAFLPYDGGAEITFWIAPQYWGLGYATEAAEALLRFAAAAGHVWIFARCPAANPLANRMLRKIGFEPANGALTSNASGTVVMQLNSLRHSRLKCADGLSLPYDAELKAA